MVTKVRKVIFISLQPDRDDLYEKQFQTLSNDILELSRGLYSYDIYCRYDVYRPEFTDHQLFDEFDMHGPLQDRTADEVWVFGSPKSGSAMGGSKAFWLGDVPLSGTDNIYRRFPLMRFGTIDPLLTFARRVEATMYRVYEGYPPAKNMWERYIRNERTHSGHASCGSVSVPPNGVLHGYDARLSILSDSEDWLLHYPDLRNRVQFIDSRDWGGTQAGYLKWWLRHLPHGVRKTDGIHDNWWHYIMNLDLVK